MQLIRAPSDNLDGCQVLEKPADLKAQKFVWLVKRGERYDGSPRHLESTYILLFKSHTNIQGKCTYIKKANNAQLSGAYAVIVAHNDPTVNVKNIIPYATGHYSSLEIPIILIGFKDGLTMLTFFKESQKEVILSMGIEMTGDKSMVLETEYWLNPGNPNSYIFLPLLHKILNKFGDKVEFKPKYKFQNLQNKDYSKDFFKNHCVGSARFCQIENSEVKPLNVIEEAVRQICLWKITNGPDQTDPEITSQYWKYILYYSECLATYKYDHQGELECSERGFEVGRVTQGVVEKVKECMGPDDPHSETREMLLIENENSYEYSDIYLVPAFFINSELLKEEISERSIVVALCDKLIEKPDYCEKYFIGKNRPSYKLRDSMSGLLLFTIFGTIILILILLICLRRNMNKGIDREIYAEVNTYVSNYMRIKE